MKRFHFLASAVITLGSGFTAALVACGGSTEDSAIVANGDGGSTSSTSSGASTTSSGGSTTSSGGSTSSSGGTTDGGTSSGDGGATGATPNKVACGTTTCTSPTQKCCTTFSQAGGATSTCIAAADDCQGAAQRCDDKTDCAAGEVCCGGGGGGGGGGGSFGARCTADCSEGIQICKAANECVDAGTCQTYTCFNQQVSLCRKPQFGCQ